MSEQKRPVTQLQAFSPTVADHPSQVSSLAALPKTQALTDVSAREESLEPAETQTYKKTPLVSQSSPSLPKPRLSEENETSPSKFEGTEVERVKSTSRGPYDEFMALDQAGPAMIGSENSKEPNLVAIKRVKKTNGSRVDRIPPFTSDHLVQIKDMYENGSEVVIVSEAMDVTLRQLTGILQGPLKAFQIAAICKELVDGLMFLHEKLAHYHGALSCGTILLDVDGRVKIANVGESIIENKKLNPDGERNDILSLGPVMMELMEPETFILEPNCVALRNADVWKDGHGIKDFLAATQQSTLKMLKDHDFLPKKPIWKCLRPHVYCAVRAANLGCNVLSLP